MQYEGNIIRPPSEADSIILQVTTGCSHNKCTFCGAYKDKSFKVKLENLDSDLDFAAKYCKRQSRVFLADGDALILPFSDLQAILKKIQIALPWVKRVSLYGNCRAIRSKTTEQLIRLRSLGLDRIYLGLESGHDQILQEIQKGESAESMIDAAQKIQSAKLFLSVTVLLGIAGASMSQEHAIATAKTVTAMSPNQIAALTVMPIGGTTLHEQIENGHFCLPDAQTILKELRTVIELITLDRVQFYANHASNYLPISGRLQKDKDSFLSIIDAGLNGSVDLVDEKWRAL